MKLSFSIAKNPTKPTQDSACVMEIGKSFVRISIWKGIVSFIIKLIKEFNEDDSDRHLELVKLK